MKRSYLTWQTRALAGFIAASGMSSSDQLVRQAQTLSMEAEEETAPEPAPGSFERLAGLVSSRRPG